MKKLTLAYLGSPDFSAKLLEKLIQDNLPIEIKFVVTQPDKPVGRKQIITPSPVKVVAEKYGIHIITSLKTDGKKLFSEIDLGLLYAYGEIIPQEILDQSKFGFWNVHPSLLPKYRGPSPIVFPLINGDRKTGVTLIRMDSELDHGPIIDQQELVIDPDVKRPDLENQLTDLGYQLFKKSLLRLITDNRQPITKSQNHSQATYTRLFKKENGYLEWQKLKQSTDPQKIYNLFRGLYPWPGIWTLLRPTDFAGQAKIEKLMRLKILDINYEKGKLLLKTVQLEGKKPVDFNTFSKAYNLS